MATRSKAKNRTDFSYLLKYNPKSTTENTTPATADVVHVGTIKSNDIKIDYNLDTIIDAINTLKDLSKLYSYCNEKIQYEQDITQDLLHAMEFCDDYNKRNKLSTLIHHNRQRRRVYKDTSVVLKNIVEFLNEEQNMRCLNKLLNILGDARKIKNHSTERAYTPRILTELGVFYNGKSTENNE